jgi:hypothetical protein
MRNLTRIARIKHKLHELLGEICVFIRIIRVILQSEWFCAFIWHRLDASIASLRACRSFS